MAKAPEWLGSAAPLSQECAAQREPLVVAEVNRLTNRVTDLSDAVNSLRGRLSRVCTKASQSNNKGRPVEPASGVELADILQGQRSNIEDITDNVHELLQSLEV